MGDCKACRGKGTMRGHDGKLERFTRVQCIHCLGTGRELNVFQRRIRVRSTRGGLHLPTLAWKCLVAALLVAFVAWVVHAVLTPEPVPSGESPAPGAISPLAAPGSGG